MNQAEFDILFSPEAGSRAGKAEVGRRDLARRRTRRRAKLLLEERLRFETLLSELSAGLIHVAAATSTRRSSADSSRSSRSWAWIAAISTNTSDGGPGVRISWAPPGVEELPRVMDADQFPWTAERLRRGDVVRFSRVDELPAAAAIDRASYERVGTRSHVSLPLRAGGPMLGVLSFDSVRDERRLAGRAGGAAPPAERGVRQRPGAQADGALARRAAALREAPVGAVGRLQPSVGRRFRSRGPARASPGRRLPGRRSRQPDRVLPGRPDRPFVGDRGMDGRRRVPVDDGPAAARRRRQLLAARGASGRGGRGSAELSRAPRQAPGRGAAAGRAGSSWAGWCSARSAPSARSRTS